MAPSSAHDSSLAARGVPGSNAGSRILSQPHMNTATAIIDGACVMLGSLTKYQSRNEPAITSVTASPAMPAGK